MKVKNTFFLNEIGSHINWISMKFMVITRQRSNKKYRTNDTTCKLGFGSCQFQSEMENIYLMVMIQI